MYLISRMDNLEKMSHLEDTDNGSLMLSVKNIGNKLPLTLTEGQLDNLQWAKEFMDKYERKHKNARIRK